MGYRSSLAAATLPGQISPSGYAPLNSKRVPTLFWMKASGKRAAMRVDRAPAGAVGGDEVVGREVRERVAGRRDDRLEMRSAEVEASDHRVDAVVAGQRRTWRRMFTIPECPQPVSTTRPRPRTFATSAWSSRISGSGCQRPSPVRLVGGEPLLEPGRAVDLARDQQRPVEQERRLLLLDDVEAGALERALAGGRQLERFAAGQGHPAAAPELGWISTGSCARPSAAASPCIPVV